ncbi:MAG: hypothetical protein H7Y13_05055 [Sphingobacteriaceae bacterium]|nr:hypothetical protein [Sphingobacteriaceae bacterium]
MEIHLPFASDDCIGLSETDFADYKIPEPPQGVKKGRSKTHLLFNNSEEALKYAIHLNDVHERMEASSEYECSKKKIRQIIEAVNQQVDFKSINFD